MDNIHLNTQQIKGYHEYEASLNRFAVNLSRALYFELTSLGQDNIDDLDVRVKSVEQGKVEVGKESDNYYSK